MRCSNCGKTGIPFLGSVCPYCHASKGKDQIITVVPFPIAVIFVIWVFVKLVHIIL